MTCPGGGYIRQSYILFVCYCSHYFLSPLVRPLRLPMTWGEMSVYTYNQTRYLATRIELVWPWWLTTNRSAADELRYIDLMLWSWTQNTKRNKKHKNAKYKQILLYFVFNFVTVILVVVVSLVTVVWIPESILIITTTTTTTIKVLESHCQLQWATACRLCEVKLYLLYFTFVSRPHKEAS